MSETRWHCLLCDAIYPDSEKHQCHPQYIVEELLPSERQDMASLLARIRELEAAARVAAIETEERCIEEATAARENERERCLAAVQRIMGGWGWMDNALEIMAELDAAIVSSSPTCPGCGEALADGTDYVTLSNGETRHCRCLR